MAESLAAFYLKEHKRVWTWVSLETFLGAIDIEAYDTVGLLHDHAAPDGRLCAARVMGASRQFGLGSKRRPDLVQLALRLSPGAPCKASAANIEVAQSGITVGPQPTRAPARAGVSGVSQAERLRATVYGNASLSTAWKKFGTASLLMDNASPAASKSAGVSIAPGNFGWAAAPAWTIEFWFLPKTLGASVHINTPCARLEQLDEANGNGHHPHCQRRLPPNLFYRTHRKRRRADSRRKAMRAAISPRATRPCQSP